ncbi:retrovirus-related pol polyprotein from transposon TNT 1-94 [Tanacetum coccineum]
MRSQLNDFENITKVRTKVTAQNEGTRGFEHIRKAFEKDVIPFVKSFRDSFITFDQVLFKEINKMKEVFNQMETEHIIYQDVMCIAMHDDLDNKCVVPTNDDNLTYAQMEQSFLDEYSRLQLMKESLRNQKSCKNQDAPEFPEFFEINELKAQLKRKNKTINNLKDHIASLKGKSVYDCTVSINNSCVIAPEMYKLDLEPLSPKLRKNWEAHVDYLQKAKEHADTLRDIVEQARAQQPLDNALANACKFTTCIQELLVYVNATCLSSLKKNEKSVVSTPMNKSKKVWFEEPKKSTRVKSSTSASGSQPSGNTKKNRISRTTSSNQKNRVKDRLTSVKSSLNKKNRVSECNIPIERTFPIVGNKCPLTRITSTTVVPPKQPVPAKVVKKTPPSSNNLGKPKAKTHFMGTVRFGNDHVAAIMGYGDYQIGNVMISQLSHLNFDTINELAKQGLVKGLPKLKYQKDHLCSACSLGKSKKHTHKPKSEDFIQEKLYLLHMDLCGPMRIESINGKKYILVIVDDFSRFTWVKFLRSKDETSEFKIKFQKQIQVRLNATVRNIRTDNGIEFVNQTVQAYYEDVRISHQTSVARTPQQNNIVKRQNQTLVKATRTMLIFSKAPLFLKDLGKLKPKADIEIFIGYSPAKKAFRIYNKRTRLIMETIHVEFDELTSMASEQFGSGPELQLVTPGTISSGLPPSVVSCDPPAAAAPILVDTIGTPSLTSVDQDAPSTSTLLTLEASQEPVLHQDVEVQEPPNAQFNDPFANIFNQEPSYEE